MALALNRGYYYWVKRVPKRYRDVVRGLDGQPISQVRVALQTDSRKEAEARAPLVEAERMAEWEAMLSGDSASAARHYAAIKEIAARKGFVYTPAPRLRDSDVQDILERLAALADRSGTLTAPRQVVKALLGAVPEALPTFPEVLAEYYELTSTRHLKKSESQLRRWRIPRDRAVRNFVEITSARSESGVPIALPVNEITREHALKYRKWWVDRVAEGLAPGSANKEIGHLSEILSTWIELKQVNMENPFEKMRLDGDESGQRPAFSRAWVRDHLLAPGAFDRTNEESRDILFMMINTGCRPSEITDAPPEDYVLDAPIPFLRIAPHGRELKVAHSRRDIPLLGVSLEAAKRIKGRGGIIRYRMRSNNWSASINKFMGKNGLKETPAHTAYSLRHYVENALLSAGVDHRVRVDILGHRYERPLYGDGGGLEARAEALARIAL